MANEVKFTDTTGGTDYFLVIDSAGLFRRTTGGAFETYNVANYTDYDHPATEVGATGIYMGDIPVLVAGDYTIVAKRQAGATPTATDQPVAVGPWDSAATIADKLLGRNLAGGADGGRTVRDALRALRNRVVRDDVNGIITVYEEDDVTPAWTATMTTTPAASPVTEIDPT